MESLESGIVFRKLSFRKLRTDEIECRVGTCNDKGLTLLLYKDARCDMNILDETVGALNWKREHSRDNHNCTVSIFDNYKREWVSKEDVGTESNTEAEKGLASDSFKRACTNWGIGRELYSAPFLWVKKGNYDEIIKNNKPTTRDKFVVAAIEYDDVGNISKLCIVNASRGNAVVVNEGYSSAKEITASRRAEQTRKEEIIKARRGES